ncbi:phospholipase D family protein [Roseibium salinum]|uniref:Phospholipase D family protein n=1 Tax=Roseibium salinum TaxID=1604349 RepID=A0ABT3R618_9HYPH|nr:phospholipase D family protein [Roseibium sp. DSM 29163]MCX2724511.1 phospholipase D family protein [Roseibium sp. DSM 29163]
MKIGDRLLSVLSDAEATVRIAAPFIKANALERALRAVKDEVDVTCVTRWRPEDIASGVCDLEIFDVIRSRRRSVLLIHPHLHAKFFASDTCCLVGSANLSHTALGWRAPSNLELLIQLDTSGHGLDAWWNELQSESIRATEEIRSALEHKAAELRASGKPIPLPEAEQNSIYHDAIWVPGCPRWTGLWEVYSGDEEQLPSSAIASAKSDLAALSLPPGMDISGFEVALKAMFRRTLIFQEIESLSRAGLSDTIAHRFLSEQCDVEEADAPRRWQVLKRWLCELFPSEFQIETSQEVLLKGKKF